MINFSNGYQNWNDEQNYDDENNLGHKLSKARVVEQHGFDKDFDKFEEKLLYDLNKFVVLKLARYFNKKF